VAPVGKPHHCYKTCKNPNDLATLLVFSITHAYPGHYENRSAAHSVVNK
jgi:hypothetical protein